MPARPIPKSSPARTIESDGTAVGTTTSIASLRNSTTVPFGAVDVVDSSTAASLTIR